MSTTIGMLPGVEARQAFLDLSADGRLELLDLLEERFVIPRPIEVYVGELRLTNESGRELINECKELPVESWSFEQLVFLTTLWLWELGKGSLNELNQADLTFSMLDDFYRDKHARYLELLGRESVPAPDSLFELVRQLPELRTEIERDHVRCVRINGPSWERREWFMSKASLAVDQIPASLVDFVRERTGFRLPDGDDHRQRWGGLVEEMVAKGVNPAEVLVALADYAVADPVLRADYAIITCARGTHFDQPWKLQLIDVMSYTAVREGFDPGEHRVRLTIPQIRNAIAQRMRYNVVCRSRNYSPVRAERMQAQAFQIPDIALMEDAHHNGHQANGVRFVTRAPFVLEASVEGELRSFRGLADFRCNRASYVDEDQFTPAELRYVLRMSLWEKAIVERGFRLGVLLDEKYCSKQDFYSDKDGAKLRDGGVIEA